MMSRHSVILKNIKCYNLAYKYRAFHNINSLLFKSCSTNSSIFRQSHSSQNNKSKKSNLPYIFGLGAAVVGGAYYYFSKNKSSPATPETLDADDIPFVYENLDEDLAALKEYGKIPYLLIGAGSTSFSAYRSIRTADPNAKVLIIGDEPYHPYMRPPLSKEVWFEPNEDVVETLNYTLWSGRKRSLLYETPEYYFPVKDILNNPNGGVAVIPGTKVAKVDPVSQVVHLEKGGEISYEKCLIATGSTPKSMPVFENADDSIKKQVSLFKTIKDFKKLNKLLKKVDSIVIVGGGFLGSELAYGINKKSGLGKFKVTQIFPETGNVGKILPEYLSKWTSKKLNDEGIEIISDATVKSVIKDGNKLVLQLSNDQTIKTDHVIVAVGSDANTDIAKSSGLEIDEKIGGFVVNTEMEARKNLWIGGDASCFYDILLGRRRVEHHDHATVSGTLAGKNMTGAGIPYNHQSMFWSDLGPDIGFEGIGIVDSSLPTVGIFVKDTERDLTMSSLESKVSDIPNEELQKAVESQTTSENTPVDQAPRAPNQKDAYNKGVIFYLRDNIVVGIVLWNVFTKMSIARKIISEAKSYDDLTEVAKLFELKSEELN